MLELPYVEATLSFLGAATSTPTHYLDLDPPAGVPARYPVVERRVRFHDARGIAGDLSIDREGFVLVRHPEGVLPDFRDERAVAQHYYPALERLVAAVTGAARVVVFDHTLRSSGVAMRTAAGIDTAVTEAHNDYTPSSGPARVREMLGRHCPGEDPDRLMRGRYAIVNVWRPTNGVVEQMPLGVCDMRTMAPDDFADVVLHWRHRTGYVSAVRYSPQQRWYYVSALRPDEALVFKCFDSAETGGVRFSAHAAFDDPATPPGARIRESIEARCIALYGAP